jgi:hypothetical protein
MRTLMRAGFQRCQRRLWVCMLGLRRGEIGRCWVGEIRKCAKGWVVTTIWEFVVSTWKESWVWNGVLVRSEGGGGCVLPRCPSLGVWFKRREGIWRGV